LFAGDVLGLLTEVLLAARGESLAELEAALSDRLLRMPGRTLLSSSST